MHRRPLLALIIAAIALARSTAALAQGTQKSFSPEELDQMLASIALYPDSLLAQILMATTYPLEIVEAARWSRSNPALKGDAAVAAIQDKNWDVSVKSLVAFPDVLKQLSDHLDWTQRLGDAMLGQQQDVADSIQRLRGKASVAGNLKSTPQQTVTTQGSGDSTQYVIEPASPDIVYVPSYNPSWAYGSWPYPQYPPVYYPFAGALARGIFWGLAFAAAGSLYAGWNWAGHGNSYANVNVNRATNIDRSFDRTKIDGDRWQHRPEHRRGVGYRDDATRQRFGQQARPGVEQRDQFRGKLDNQGRPGTGAGQRPGGAPGAAQRPVDNQRSTGNRRPGAIDGVNRGQQVNRESQRGRQQRNRPGGSGGRPGGGGGGRPGGGGGRPGGGGRR